MPQSFLASNSRRAAAAAPLSPAAAHWLAQQGVTVASARAIPGDASGRRYWRLSPGLIFMDAPPPEDILSFLRVQHRFARAALPVPRVLAAQIAPGFVLLEDLGNDDFKTVLDAGADVDRWMQQAITLVLNLQQAGQRQAALPPLPFFSPARLQDELTLFTDWYLGRHLGLVPSPQQSITLQTLFAVLLNNAAAQPQVWVHRDFHARNLIIRRDTGLLAMIDFQDAVLGPWTYDLASLLWDRYWDWGRAQRDAWALDFLAAHQHAVALSSPTDFLRRVGRMALQRNLKILGIFCRLAYRDGKSGYLDFLPRFWAYVVDALDADPLLQPYQELFAPWQPPLPGR
ncbi:aminoglycoside phosphotransferase family protein [Acidithiobacillus ferrivorans]|uniref:aminoglycoside phosphotransferase family protein n=1 Tax=Acidithiobacillus ferrivorans TaxID=160808 RepID=UPI001C068FEF|nr:phosphotransferase [Acidithiobacillus ferrivorans]MBU2850037.1 phosphotransferase [Acidithiobacillus ferrivorans]